MKAYQITKNLNGLTDLPACLLKNVESPIPGPDEVLVNVNCAGMNFFDILQVQGKYQDQPPFPFIPGSEFSGMISKDSPIPTGCNFIPGKTRVFGSTQGAYAEKVKARWDRLIEMPDGLSFEQSAGLYITYPTSYVALVNRGQLKKGEWCLIHAAAGGVGIAAVQIAKALGARVIATASSQQKLDFVRKEGGLSPIDDHTIVYSDTVVTSAPDAKKKPGKLLEWQAEVMKITKGKGVDVVFDPVGLLNKSLKVSGWNSRLVVVGFAGGDIEKVPANLLLLKNSAVTGVFWGAHLKNEPETVTQVWLSILELVKRGQIRPVLHPKIYQGLESLQEGLNDLANRKVLAKAILQIKVEPSGKSKL
ncbi:uncharacterized protein MELLADRAFT_49522 [Melampsora larici-populina 98AG31]|uniref:Enoyl reductase (ER) domain-containing protein n=1 Tax=Melampsora larici-populina (strain 98AG31 / pathotype 3-4-7) TaxID=747676 RepID=F4RW65_MELLP|nr:uncharacterized protein MELLADRAFT_49522 [Melampsora larici-populina 98AG31]EGG03227.1 hypothetical protein MELLADRAFT_49522 [Melampsora larici-populina 98AG31]